MKTAVVLALLAGANAFTTSPAATRPKTAVNTVWDDYSGGIEFRAQKFEFDPFGFAETYKPFLPFLRESEIRHGRTAMLAVVGFIVPDFVRIPGDLYSFESIPNTIDAHDALLKNGPMYQLLLWIGLFDLFFGYPAIQATLDGEREPGYFGWTWFEPKDDAGKKKKRDSELLNGRLAMVAIGGIATQSVISGHGFPYI